MSGTIKKTIKKAKQLSDEFKNRKKSKSGATGAAGGSEASRSSPQASGWKKVTDEGELGPLKAAADEFRKKVHNVLNDVNNARNQVTGGNKYYLWYRVKGKGKEIEVVLANREPPQDYKTAGEDVLGSVVFNADNVQDQNTWERLERYAKPDSNEGWQDVFN